MGQIIDFSKEPEDIGEWMNKQSEQCEGFKPCASGMSPFGDYFSGFHFNTLQATVLGMLTTCMWINTQEKRDCETCECKGLCELFKDAFEKECEKIKEEK